MSVPHPPIHTDRLVLRPLTFDDVDDVYAYANDSEWVRYTLAVPWPYEREDAVKWIASRTLVPCKAGQCMLATEYEGHIIGATALHARSEGVAEIGYSVGRAHWGRGIAAEACRALLAHGYGDLGLEVVYARIDPANAASQSVVGKLGFTYEGTLRGRDLRRGERVDHQHWSLLATEWNA